MRLTSKYLYTHTMCDSNQITFRTLRLRSNIYCIALKEESCVLCVPTASSSVLYFNVCPTCFQRLCSNVCPTSVFQRVSNVCVPTCVQRLFQRVSNACVQRLCSNVCPTSVSNVCVPTCVQRLCSK